MWYYNTTYILYITHYPWSLYQNHCNVYFFLNYPALFFLNSKEFCVEWIEIPGNQIFTSLPFTHHPAYLLLPNPCGVAVRFRHLSSKRSEWIQSTFLGGERHLLWSTKLFPFLCLLSMWSTTFGSLEQKKGSIPSMKWRCQKLTKRFILKYTPWN